jgi:hypothetical protein
MGDAVHPNHSDDMLLHMLAGHGAIHDRSIAGPLLRRRLVTSRRGRAQSEGREYDSPLMQKLAASYNGYRLALMSKVASMNYFLSTHPLLVTEVLGRDPVLASFSKVKTASSALVPESLTYLMGAFYNDRTKLAGTKECRAVQARLGSV